MFNMRYFSFAVEILIIDNVRVFVVIVFGFFQSHARLFTSMDAYMKKTE